MKVRIGEFLQNPVFEGYVVNEYFNLDSMKRSAMQPRPIEEYFRDKNKIEDFDKIIIEPKSKKISLLVHSS